MATPLNQLGEHGQSVWLDFISRELVTTGELQRLIAEDNVTGMTSNPTIFQKAIAEGSLYDEQIRELIASGIDDPNDVFTELAVSDIQHATDILRPIHERTSGADGYVSLEVPPSLSHDTDATIAMARTLWERVDRPNLMIKIPATLEGMPAIAGADPDIGHEALDEQVEIVRIQSQRVARRQLADRVDRLQSLDPRRQRGQVLVHGASVPSRGSQDLRTGMTSAANSSRDSCPSARGMPEASPE